MLHIVLPTCNEESIIRSTLERLTVFLQLVQHQVLNNWQIIVADNGSTDATRAIVREASARDSRIELIEIPTPGKGGAVITAWQRTAQQADSSGLTPDAFLFMDADLATDLEVLPKMVATIRDGADIAVGSRFAPGARVERGVLRRIISRVNQLLLKMFFGLRVADAPCGFKVVNERVIREIVPLVRDTQWFFDTELLIRAQRAGMRIVEIPVTWREIRRGNESKKILRIIARNLRAMIGLVCEQRS